MGFAKTARNGNGYPAESEKSVIGAAGLPAAAATELLRRKT